MTTDIAGIETTSTVVDPQAAADLMVALERVFRIGVYYPAGHALCDQAAEVFLGALRRIVKRAPVLRFEIVNDTLTVQGLELDPTLRGVQDFVDLLGELGVVAIEIEAGLTPVELHCFVSQLLAFRNRVKSAHNFQQIVVDGMPPSIAIAQREFLARETPGNGEVDGSGLINGENPSIEALLAALAERGLDPEEIETCRHLLASVPEHLRTHPQATSSPSQVSWADVETLLVRAAREASGDATVATAPTGLAARSSPHAGLDALAAIFEALGRRTDNTESREVIDLLLSVLKRAPSAIAAASSAAKPHASRPGDAGSAMPLAELKERIRACDGDAASALTLIPGDRCEELTILMQAFTHDQRPQAQMRIQKRLREILVTPLQPCEWDVVAAGVRHLLDLGLPERLPGTMLVVLDALHRSEFSTSLRFLADVARGCPSTHVGSLWPFLVNELLLQGTGTDYDVFVEICTVASMPTLREMQAGLPMLESLEALRDHRCARSLFTPPPSELHGVFLALLQSPHATFIGDRLLIGLRYKPLNWLSEAVLPLLKRFQPRHRHFLVDVLRLGVQDTIPLAVAENAGRIIAEALPALPRRERAETWVVAAVQAIGRLPVASGEQLLDSIARARRYWILHDWPEVTRRAARETLAALREVQQPTEE